MKDNGAAAHSMTCVARGGGRPPPKATRCLITFGPWIFFRNRASDGRSLGERKRVALRSRSDRVWPIFILGPAAASARRFQRHPIRSRQPTPIPRPTATRRGGSMDALIDARQPIPVFGPAATNRRRQSPIMTAPRQPIPVLGPAGTDAMEKSRQRKSLRQPIPVLEPAATSAAIRGSSSTTPCVSRSRFSNPLRR